MVETVDREERAQSPEPTNRSQEYRGALGSRRDSRLQGW